ncbi:S1C family serine protease [Vampirovibrio sp.]|uniref:S1C family serine protease n=1 Tax=Vampirovibrio sp. TaxID=2717857 RepID=UPI0035932C73
MITVHRSILAFTCFLTVVLSVAVPAQALAYAPQFDVEEQDNIGVYERAAQAVVTINALVDGHPSSGAGVLIDESGIILTSSHVIGNATKVQVSLSDGRRTAASVIGRAGEKSDLALLRVNMGGSLPFLKLGDSAQIKVGQKVLAIGNPYGFERTLTTGIISRIDTERNRIQTDAAINPGNSGGPLLDTQGFIIGINQSIFNPDGNRSNIGIGFAVPANTVKGFLVTLANQRPIPATVAAISKQPVIRYRERAEDTITADNGIANVSVLLQKVGQ